MPIWLEPDLFEQEGEFETVGLASNLQLFVLCTRPALTPLMSLLSLILVPLKWPVSDASGFGSSAVLFQEEFPLGYYLPER